MILTLLKEQNFLQMILWNLHLLIMKLIAFLKRLSSIPLSDIDFPKVVFMVVDNKIELQTKLLNDYPEWQFLSKKG